MKSSSEQALDVLAQWAGEEFVASGRAAKEDRSIHRSRAHLLAEMLRELRRRDTDAEDWTEELVEDRPATETDPSRS